MMTLMFVLEHSCIDHRIQANTLHNKSKILTLDQESLPLIMPPRPSPTNLFLIRHKHKTIAKSSHRSLLPLRQSYIPRNLHRQRHVALKLSLRSLAVDRIQVRVEHMYVHRLRLEVRPRHLLLEAVLEDARILKQLTVVADVREAAACRECLSGHVEGFDLVA